MTDDPVPVDYQGWEINTAVLGTALRGGGFVSVPNVDANYGAFPGVQLHVQPQVLVDWDSSGREVGLGDTQLGAKIRLVDEDRQGWIPMIAVYPIFTVPTGSARRGTGTGQMETFLPVWVDKTIGKWILDGGAGYGIDPGGRGRNAVFAGALVLYQFTDRFQFGGEAFVQTAQVRGGRTAPGFNLGGSYDLSKMYHLLFSAGRGLANVSETNRASGYLGLQITF